MANKINHLGKVRTSYYLDLQILKGAKIQASKECLTAGNIIERALTDYFWKVRLAEAKKERLRKKEELTEKMKNKYSIYGSSV